MVLVKSIKESIEETYLDEPAGHFEKQRPVSDNSGQTEREFRANREREREIGERGREGLVRYLHAEACRHVALLPGLARLAEAAGV